MAIPYEQMLAADLQPPTRMRPLAALADVRDGVQSTAVLAVAGSMLTACGGGGGSGGAAVAGGAPADDAPVMLPSAVEASRFLSQAAWGGNDADIAELRAAGYESWLARQFEVPATQSHFDWLLAGNYQRDELKFSTNGLDSTIWRKMISSPDQLRQRMVLALSEIFVLSPAGLPAPYSQFACAGYLDLLERHAFGNFRDLLEAVTLSPAMGLYLSMMGNEKEDPATGRMPDENYAREIMQLFSIGLYQLASDGSIRPDSQGRPRETYDNEDVMGLARVFTGWDLENLGGNIEAIRRPMVFNAGKHSTSDKHFLGVTIPGGMDGRQALALALDTLSAHANVGPFIGRQLIQRFVTSNPSPAYVARVSAAFNDNGHGVRGDLRAVLCAVLLDAEARQPGTSPAAGKLREPVVRFVQWARTFSAASPSGIWGIGNTSDPATRLGQGPLRSRTVFNFFRPDYVPPRSVLAQRDLALPEMQITSEISVLAYLNLMQYVIRHGADDVAANYSAELAMAGDSERLVERCNLLLAAGQMSESSRILIRDAINTIPVTTDVGRLNRVCSAIFMTMAAPEYLVLK